MESAREVFAVEPCSGLKGECGIGTDPPMADCLDVLFHAVELIHRGQSSLTSVAAARECARIDRRKASAPLRILLENLLRFRRRNAVNTEDLLCLARLDSKEEPTRRSLFIRPGSSAGLTGVPCVVDLAALRDAMAKWAASPAKIKSRSSRRARQRSLRHSTTSATRKPSS